MKQRLMTEFHGTAADAWRIICRAVRSHISSSLYRACFTGTQGLSLTADYLRIAVPNATVQQLMQQRFAPLLAALVAQHLTSNVELRFICASDEKWDDIPTSVETSLPEFVSIPTPSLAILPPSLHEHFTFENFIVGDSNRFAFAAAQSVAATPGSTYNPLFLYGGVGLGKTHLLMAIGHVAIQNNLRVCYVTAETFTNEIIDAIQTNSQEQFRARYREMDVLLVDDIQFIGGKQRTEEEFFHTFNALHIANKQIVVTSDRPPRAIPTLHDRLRSRFEWGLLADVAAPEYEHRLAIIQAKAAMMNLPIPPMALEYLARPDGMNVRSLEGALNHLQAAARLHDNVIAMPLVAATLRECFGASGHLELSPRTVVDIIANHYHIEPEELLGKGRSRQLTWPRQIAMYLLREETEISLAQIGTALGGRDHTTIMHGYEHVATTVRLDERIRQEVATLRDALHML